MKRTYEFLGYFAFNAFFATYLCSMSVRVIRRALMESHFAPTTVPSYIELNVLASFAVAFALGLALWFAFPMRAAKWTWVLSVGLIFVEIGVFRSEQSVLGADSFLKYVFGLGNSQGTVSAFAIFTVPLISATAYSIGTWSAAFLKSSTVSER